MNRLLNTSSSTGSAVRADRVRALRAARRARARGGCAASTSRASPARRRWSRCARAMIAGPAIASPGRRSSRSIDRRLVARAVGVDARARVSGRERSRRARAELPAAYRRRVASRRSPRPRPPRSTSGLLRHQEAVALRGSASRTRRRIAGSDVRTRDDSSVVSVPSYLRCSVRRTRDPLARRRPARAPRRAPSRRARRAPRSAAASAAGVSARLDRLLPQRAHVGQTHAVRRQHAGERMDEDARHAERVGDEAGVLAAGAAEAAQRVLGDVVAALHRDVLDRVGHVLDRDRAGSRRRLPRRVRAVAGRAATSAASAANFVAHDRRRRAAGRRPGRTPSGKSSGSSLPSITLQSVTVSGPPRR